MHFFIYYGINPFLLGCPSHFQVGVCESLPSSRKPTGADHPAPPFPSTNGADAGDRSANGFPTPVRCSHRIRSPKPSPCPNRTDTMRCNVTFNFRGLDIWYYAVSPSLYINFFNKTSSYLLSVIKNKK